MFERETHDLLQHDEADRAAWLAGRQADEALDLAGQRDQRAHDLAVMVRDQQQRHHQPHIGDEGKRMRRIDGERRQHREDALHEESVEPFAIGHAQRVHLGHDQPGMGELALHLVPGVLLVGDEPAGADVHVGQLLRGRLPVGRDGRHARLRLADEAGDADGIEFVEVRPADRDEAQPLQQRVVAVLRLLDDAMVEIEPGQFAVDEPRRGIAGDRFRRRRGCRRRVRARRFRPDVRLHAEMFCC